MCHQPLNPTGELVVTANSAVPPLAASGVMRWPLEKIMAEGSDAVKELSSGIRGLFDRIGEFFHLFDLSFFVSGAITFSALAYWWWQQKKPTLALPSSTWLRVVALVVLCYVCGLLSFAAGRFAASLWRRTWPSRKEFFTKLLRETIESHDISTSEIRPYLTGPDKPWRLYERLWVDLRESRERATSFALLNRYWVMAATYDGIAISCAVWVPVLASIPPLEGTFNRIVLPTLAAGCSVLAFWQWHNYFKYQVFEIVATLAASKARLMPVETKALTPTEVKIVVPVEVEAVT